MRKTSVFSYADILLLCFCIGVVTGTVLVNGLSSEVITKTGYFGTDSVYGSRVIGEGQWLEFLTVVCRQRFLEASFGWILGLTVFSVPCFYAISAYAGISAGVVLSVITMQKGLAGIFYYGLTMFPHYIVYIPVWCILAFWAGRMTGKIRIIQMAALLGLVFFGAVLESYVNPILLQMLF